MLMLAITIVIIAILLLIVVIPLLVVLLRRPFLLVVGECSSTSDRKSLPSPRLPWSALHPCFLRAQRGNVRTLCLSMHAPRPEETIPVPAAVDASTSVAASRVTRHPSTPYGCASTKTMRA